MKRMKRTEDSSRGPLDKVKCTKIQIIGVREEEKKKRQRTTTQIKEQAGNTESKKKKKKKKKKSKQANYLKNNSE